MPLFGPPFGGQAAAGMVGYAKLPSTSMIANRLIMVGTDGQTLNDIGGLLAWNSGSNALVLEAGAATTNAVMRLQALAGAGAGDPQIEFVVPSGGNTWTIGVDKSDSSKLKICLGSVIGTGTYVTLDSSGNLVVENGGVVQHTLGSSGGFNARTQLQVGSVPCASADATYVNFGSLSGSYVRQLRLYASDVLLLTASATLAQFNSTHNVLVGGTLATNATTGFLRLPTCAGVPSGALNDGAIIVDTTNNRLYYRSGSAWRYLTGT